MYTISMIIFSVNEIVIINSKIVHVKLSAQIFKRFQCFRCFFSLLSHVFVLYFIESYCSPSQHTCGAPNARFLLTPVPTFSPTALHDIYDYLYVPFPAVDGFREQNRRRIVAKTNLPCRRFYRQRRLTRSTARTR
jgi:hypothetical protein